MQITQQTRIHTLLTAYPQLVQVLIDINPQFAKLKNPVLRNSIGRVATLKQAAETVGMSPAVLIEKLQQAINEIPPC